MYKYYNPNPLDNHVPDCAIRAVAKALDISWEEAYLKIALNGYYMGNIMSSNDVWGAVLRANGFARKRLTDSCPDCYTINDFLNDHPRGVFVIVTGSHAVAAIDGTIYDIFDSSSEIPLFYWQKKIGG